MEIIQAEIEAECQKTLFSQRVVNFWNNLPSEVVEASSTNAFKNRIDKHWKGKRWMDIKAQGCDTMRIQCTICTELFDGLSDIAAVPCGHVFHGECLSKWLANSMTCPQCRARCTHKTILSKLYLDCQPDSLDGSGNVENASQLANELESTKLVMRQRDREKSWLLAEKVAFEEQIKELTENLKAVETLHKQEITKNKTLKHELTNYQSIKREVELAKEEASSLRRKVSYLENVQSVINGCEKDIDDMIKQCTDVTQLSTWCCVYKQELERKKMDFRMQLESNRKLKKEVELLKMDLSEKNTELKSTKEHVKGLEDDVASQEQLIKGLKKRVESLQAAIESPNGTVSSFAFRLLHESPAPRPEVQPKLKHPVDKSDFVDLDQSMDLFETPSKSLDFAISPNQTEMSKSAKRKNDCMENGLKYVRITTASDPKPNPDISNPIARNPLINLNIMKKNPFSIPGQKSAVFLRGYNGLGGHEKFVKPAPRPQTIFSKSAKEMKLAQKMSKSSTLSKPPPLPSLIDLDSQT